MKKLFCMTLMILGMMSMAFAADAKGGIKGIVIDASSREALEFVNVAVREAGSDEFKSGCATDIEGRFLVENLKAGNYKVVISFVGYKSIERNVKVDNEVLNMGRIFIEEDAQQMREVQVTAQQSTMKFEIDKKVFNVGTDIASKGASATDILENIPSIEVDQEGAISLRGSSSVNVWINGKASGLTAENRGDILEQMPAENIERVEIITNPGAKYSAEGTAGIINIILKENARAGYYGSVQGGFNHHNGAPLAWNGSANINYNSGKFDFYASMGYRQRNHIRLVSVDRNNVDEHGNVLSYLNQASEGLGKGENLFARAGMSYRPTKKDEFSIGGFGMLGSSYNNSPSLYESNMPGNFVSSERIANSNTEMLGGNVEFNYIHKFNGDDHKIDLLAAYNTFGHEGESIFEQTSIYANGDTTRSYQRQPSDVSPQNFDVQLDYTNKISETQKVEAGYKGSISRESSPTRTFSGLTAEDAQEDTKLYNDFTYNQDVHALYLSYSSQIDNFGYQLGLRGEYTYFETQSLGYGQDAASTPWYKNDYFGLFPTVFLTYRLTESDELQLNYTRRLQRPWGGQLNPFVNITDSSNISYGNPQLLPQYANAYEFNYIKTWKESQTLSISAYYRSTEDMVQHISYLDATPELGGKVMKSTYFNIGESRSIGGEIVSKNRLFKLLDLTSTLNMLYYELDGYEFTPVEGTTIEGEPESNFTWNARVIGNVLLPKEWSIQLRGDYRAKSLVAQGFRYPSWRVDWGVRKGFGDLSVSLNVRDIFNKFVHINHTEGSGFSQEAFHWHGGRRINMTVSYSFGNMKPKPHKHRHSEVNDYDSYSGGGHSHDE